MPVAEPFDKMVAILVLELVQITWEVISDMEPSENIPTAIKGCDAPIFKLRGETAGSITMVANTFTIKDTGWLFNPAKLAVILAVPPPTPVAVPPEAMVVTAGLELDHTT